MAKQNLTFYVVDDAPAITAESGAAAARQYALEHGLDGGAVLVAEGARSYKLTATPPDVKATEQ